MNEYRCKFCHKLLFKYLGKLPFKDIDDIVKRDREVVVEIQCSKCKRKNITNLYAVRHSYNNTVDCEHNYELVGKETPIA